MARVTVEDCLRQVENRFALVHLAVRRVLQLRKGAAPLIDAPKNKEVVVALREIAAGKIRPDNILEMEGLDDLSLEAPLEGTAGSTTPEIQEVVQEASQGDAAASEGEMRVVNEEDAGADSDES
ncbi:DNA-directed RNA polymerase subunit omega [Desulfacinum hydrothermale DSM 13146]|uniref:DNA-directed RNA polymerase subunit omega n=1 Tax=Desulfacinum hydrothermale DSM 13146 TaxID=1121390 RepID=A0A1W1XHG9_9BACT|nr:DNA-directed RNA polymerase subunit omega [Desulfacinum hydrothermale]SMC23400.1 DNA-directed RNA polymerase subunit omega [Desulfacinum hydrothermale DSM 13146]